MPYGGRGGPTREEPDYMSDPSVVREVEPVVVPIADEEVGSMD